MAQSDAERLDELLDGVEKRLRAAFRAFVDLVQSAPAMREIIALLERSNIDGALAIVDSYIARFADALPQIASDVGLETSAELDRLTGDSALAVSFDPSNPRAAELMREHRLRFIREFSRGQREAVAQAMQRGFREGWGAAAMARAFRNAIGLTGYQEGVVANYARLLANLDRGALDRALRDRRSDEMLANAIERQRPLTAKQIDAMTDRYRRRMLIMRSETIARTEGTALMAEMRDEALEQMIEQTGIDRTRIARIWNATEDDRTREFHESMDGQRRAIDAPFQDGLGNALMRPGDRAAPAETIINCRCTLSFEIAPNR